MADIHVEEFYKDVAIALVQLYMSFPRRVNLFVEDIAGPDEPDEFGLHSKRHMACFGALLWLSEEGLLRYVDTIRQEALDQAVLTREAFVRLSAPAPQALLRELSAAFPKGTIRELPERFDAFFEQGRLRGAGHPDAMNGFLRGMERARSELVASRSSLLI